VATDRFSDNVAVYFYDPRTQHFSSEPVAAIPNFDINGIVLGSHASNFNRLLGFRYEGADYATYWVDPDLRAIQESLNSSFRDRHVSIMDFNGDLSTVLFETSSGAHPPAYYLLRNRREAVMLGESRPWMSNARMREPELVHYAARDGRQIPGILTLPVGWTHADGPLPAVILPHGGPWARDATGWDESGWPQFLASRGYAVLQPQYRGSQGWGRSLWLAGDGEWGQKMQDDKDDGAAWLVSQGIAVQDRVAIFGYSYGGFAAIAATVRPHSPYQCAIAGAGVANLTRIGHNWSDSRLQRIYQGHTVAGMDPMQHTADANIPILLIAGDRDVRVPLWHSQDFYNAVRGHVPAELIIVPDMPHSLPWYPAHYRTLLGAVERYLHDDCGPGGL
jgi:dipeptidyl aminopeptidase/acylaminoacyl peptidase